MRTPKSLTDEMLVRMMRGGHRATDQALRYLSRLHRDNMYSHVDRLGAGTIDPKDVWQNSIIVFLESVRSGKYEERFLYHTTIAGFLYGTLRNLCRNELRRQKRLTSFEENDLAATDQLIVEADFGILDESLENKLHAKLLKSGLGESCIQLLLQYYYHHMVAERVAEAMKKTKAAIEKQFQRCRQKARSLIGK